VSKSFWRVLILGIAVLLTGCATSRSEIKLDGPAVAMPAAIKKINKDQVVWIRSVVDERHFEEAPRDPSIPSLGFEGAAKSTEEIKSRAFGRKRGGFGMALGDVLLEPGQSVSNVVQDQLTAAFGDAGYRVVASEAESGSNPLVVDVHIKQFWAWINMGFWALTLNNRISTDLAFSGSVPPVIVSVHLQEQHMAITDGVWTEDLIKALQAYRTQAAEKLAKLPLKP